MSNPYTLASSSSSSSSPYRSGPSSNTSASAPQPITRSRTLYYLSIRDSSASTSYSRRPRAQQEQYGDTIDVADNEEEERLIESQGLRRGGKGLPPRWVDTSDEVEEILGRIKGKITALDKLHAKHVLPGFTDRTAEERDIERRTQDITRDFRRCTTLISSIAPSSSTRVEVLTAKNVQRGLAQKVQDASGQFRKKQRVYMQKLQGHAIKNKDLLAASGAITLNRAEGFDELQEDEQASKSQLQSQTQSQIQTSSNLNIDIETRTKEITQIASSISELADLFRDLGNLIVEQGTILDSVEYNVQTTARELGVAVEELKVAQRYQSNAGRRKCILFLILLIVGLIIILIYKPRSHGGEPPPPPSIPPTTAGSEGEILPDVPFGVVEEGGFRLT